MEKNSRISSSFRGQFRIIKIVGHLQNKIKKDILCHYLMPCPRLSSLFAFCCRCSPPRIHNPHDLAPINAKKASRKCVSVPGSAVNEMNMAASHPAGTGGAKALRRGAFIHSERFSRWAYSLFTRKWNSALLSSTHYILYILHILVLPCWSPGTSCPYFLLCRCVL